ncbi:MAG: hypothetical protein QM703_18560 [Gemmatales bacterium]
MLSRFLLIPALLILLVSASHADDAAKTCENTLAINWVLPGHFADALKQANAQQRLIMIKGIAFGIDDAGATCATKGCW